MPNLPPQLPLILLVVAMLCSLVGRIRLLGTAFGISTGWGMAVLFAPFGPTCFRLKYEDLAKPTRYWRMAVGPLMLLFFVSGGSPDTLSSLLELGKPGGLTAQTPAPVVAAPAPAPVVAQATPQPVASPAATPAIAKATPAPKATPARVAAATPAPMTMEQAQELANRIDANRHEFDRLAEWYDSLKHERGYLRKGDTEGVEAYNEEAAKYQAAVTAAKLEQANLAKLTARK
jgi:hypothetical protein